MHYQVYPTPTTYKIWSIKIALQIAKNLSYIKLTTNSSSVAQVVGYVSPNSSPIAQVVGYVSYINTSTPKVISSNLMQINCVGYVSPNRPPVGIHQKKKKTNKNTYQIEPGPKSAWYRNNKPLHHSSHHADKQDGCFLEAISTTSTSNRPSPHFEVDKDFFQKKPTL